MRTSWARRLAAVLLAGATPWAQGADPVVATEAGRVQGQVEAGLAVFRGVRYAAPPVGDARWREPQPPARWEGVLPARTVGASCIQKPGQSIASGGGDPGPTTEDCLFVNVWTPDTNPATKRPVMVWLHGGALIMGSGGVSVYDGAPLARRGAVVVTLNYRLGALGFFAHPALAGEGGAINFGLLDQIAALRWVQRNIDRFGGDPGNVTIFGESAGAQSVLALFASPLARGLFHKGIAQSAYGIPSHDVAKARATAANIATALKLGGATATAAQLRSVPAEAFAGLVGKGESLAPSFVVGDRAMPQTILAAFRKGADAPLPLLIGSNSDDGSVALLFGLDPAAIVHKLGAARIAVKSLYPRELTDEQLGRQTVRDLVFGAFARRIAYLHSGRAPTWRYFFGYVAEGVRGTQVHGVPHSAGIAFTMGTLDACACLGAPVTAADRRVAQRTMQRWFDFALTGTPVPRDADEWPRDEPAAARVLEIGATDAVRIDFMKPRLNAFIGTLNVLGRFTGSSN